MVEGQKDKSSQSSADSAQDEIDQMIENCKGKHLLIMADFAKAEHTSNVPKWRDWGR